MTSEVGAASTLERSSLDWPDGLNFFRYCPLAIGGLSKFTAKACWHKQTPFFGLPGYWLPPINFSA